MTDVVKWEYTNVGPRTDLNKFGEEGWEAYAVVLVPVSEAPGFKQFELHTFLKRKK